MQVFNLDSNILVLPEDLYKNIKEDTKHFIVESNLIEQNYYLGFNSQNTAEIISSFTEFEVIKVMDRFYLVFPPNEQTSDLFVTRFFNFIANHYEKLISVERNIQNIERLIKILLAEIPDSEKKIFLDFGCGIGLSQVFIRDWNSKNKEIE